MDDKPVVNANRIAYFANKPLPAHMLAKIEPMLEALQHLQVARSFEELVKRAYVEGFNDGLAAASGDFPSSYLDAPS